MRNRAFFTSFLTFLIFLVGIYSANAWTPMLVEEDPLVRMPGAQPADINNLEHPSRCYNCHGTDVVDINAEFNKYISPDYNWRGSMMAQAARDFIFWSCLTVGAQDSIWAVGRPNASDICERCHFPEGWLEGRSEPTNASNMKAGDFDGVQCDVCHRTYDPFFSFTYQGMRDTGYWMDFWDEASNLSKDMADLTLAEDALQADWLLLFNGRPFYTGTPNNPLNMSIFSYPTFDENAAGQYFVSNANRKRASFADAQAKHQMYYSRYHKSKYFCSTCHDVSNPILANLLSGGVDPMQTRQDFLGTDKTLYTEENPAYSYYHVERTFSEYKLSAYARVNADGSEGTATNITYYVDQLPQMSPALQVIKPVTWANKCQDCHMPDAKAGYKACNKPVLTRPTNEHPKSGVPVHFQAGGNIFVSEVLASGAPVPHGQEDPTLGLDPVNQALLNQGQEILTMTLTDGTGIDPIALMDGAVHTRYMLWSAGTIKDVNYSNEDLTFKVVNNTAHKLISGFPEGRRIWINIKAYDENNVIVYEVNPYDYTAQTLKGLDYPYQPYVPSQGNPSILTDFNIDSTLDLPIALDPSIEIHIDELIYEMKPTSTITDENKTFHFALATGRYKDNRIPPKGFDIASAAARQVEPVWLKISKPDYYSQAEYHGGYDDVSTLALGINFPINAVAFVINLYYQTTSREYIEFLRDEINGTGNLTLYEPSFARNQGWNLDPDPTYLVQTDPFFTQLKAWGNTIWELWVYNVARKVDPHTGEIGTEGGTPFLMYSATFGDICAPTEPKEVSCDDGIDNDCDGLIDVADPDCQVTNCSIYQDKETCNADTSCRWDNRNKVCINK